MTEPTKAQGEILLSGARLIPPCLPSALGENGSGFPVALAVELGVAVYSDEEDPREIIGLDPARPAVART